MVSRFVLALLVIAPAVCCAVLSDPVKDAELDRAFEDLKRKCEEWHISDHDESVIIHSVVKAVNLGVKDRTWTYLDELFRKCERTEYKGTFSYSNLYGRLFDDDIFEVEENMVMLRHVRDMYAPFYRGYEGIESVSFWKELAKDIHNGDAIRRGGIATVGIFKGAWAGIKGLWEMVTSPIQTAKGMYTMIVEYDKTSAALKKLVDEYIEAAASDPDKFADMTGQLAGQIMVTIVTPAKVIKGKDVANVFKSVANTAKQARGVGKLFHYTSSDIIPKIAKSSMLRHGQHAKGVFATTVNPALLFSNSLFGMLSRAAVLGGRLDFFFEAGRMIRLGKFKVPMPLGMKIKPPFTHAVQFMDEGFKIALRTNLEAKMGLACKSLFLQYGKKGNVALNMASTGTKFVDAALLSPSAMESLLNGLGFVVVPAALASGTVVENHPEDATDCSKPQTQCVVDKLPETALLEQEKEYGAEPYAALYKEQGKESLSQVMDGLTCCDDPHGDCCGLAAKCTGANCAASFLELSALSSEQQSRVLSPGHQCCRKDAGSCGSQECARFEEISGSLSVEHRNAFHSCCKGSDSLLSRVKTVFHGALSP